VLISELCLGVVVLLFDLAPEGGGGLLLHPPDVSHAQLQPRVQRTEHHPAPHFLPQTVTVKHLGTCTRKLLLLHVPGMSQGKADFCRWLYTQSPNFETFKEPKNRFQGINSASLCSLAGRYDNPIPTRFLAP
jgi:hypothetical protein